MLLTPSLILWLLSSILPTPSSFRMGVNPNSHTKSFILILVMDLTFFRWGPRLIQW